MGLSPSSSRPVAVHPRLGLGLLRRPGGCCRSPARCLAGFSSLGWLAGCSPGSLPFCFEQLVSAGCLGFSASLLPGEGSWFLRLAWRYGRCFWRRPFPYTWCFPDAGGNVSVSTFLGWFAILGVLVLKSRDSRFSWSLTLLAWCLESWVPYPVAPLPRVALWFFRSSRGLAELRRTSGLVLQSLCSLSTCPWPGLCGFGVIHVGCSVALLPGASAVSFASSC